MRLLYVHERFGALAGAEANVFLTAAELKRRGHCVGLIHGPGTGRNEALWKDTFLDRFEWSFARQDAALDSALEAFRPDLVYVHKMPDLRVLERLAHSGLPLVRMVHDHDIYCMRSYKYAYWTRRICTRALSPFCVFPCGSFLVRDRNSRFPVQYVSYRAKKKEVALNRRFDRMIVVTEYMKQELVRNGFAPERIEIHPPVPQSPESNLQSSFSDRNLIVYAGQIVRGKGVDVLLQSLSRMRAPFECVILGDGSHRAFCERLAGKLNLRDRVHFKGYVPQAELKEDFQECSVVAISSVWPEPIATVGLEVMHYGLPVVAFDAGGIRDWLIDGCTGFLVPWMDCTAFAWRLELLLRDKTLARQFGEQARRIARRKYHFPQYITNLENLFSRVVQERPGFP